MSGITSVPGGGVNPAENFTPPPSHKEHGKQVKGDDSQSQGNQSPDPSTSTDSTVNTYKEQSDGQDQGGGGSSGGGKGDSGGGSFSGGSGEQGSRDSREESKFVATETFGISNVVDGVSVNSALATQKVLTADMITKAAFGTSANYSSPPPGGAPDKPLLSRPANFDAAAVLKELTVNKWFSSTFLAKITVALNSIVRFQSKIQEAEAKLAVLMMDQTVQAAHLTGDLILATAVKEAEMYMAMAIASLVSLAVGVVGAGLSFAGGLKAGLSKSKLTNMKEANALKQNDAKVDVKLSTGETKAENKPKKVTFKDADGVRTDNQGNKIKDSPETEVPSNKEGIKASAKQREASQKQNKETIENADANKTEAKKSDATEAKEQATLDAEKAKKLRDAKMVGQQMQTLGTMIVQTNTSLNSVLTNFIQMVYKPEIGQLERSRTLSEARQKIIASSLDYANQAFNNAAQIIDSSIQELQKIEDETSRAGNIGG